MSIYFKIPCFLNWIPEKPKTFSIMKKGESLLIF